MQVLIWSVRALASLLPVGVLLQIYLAGGMFFGVSSPGTHRMVGEGLTLGVVALAVLASLSASTRPAVGAFVVVLALLVLQIALISFRTSVPALAALHAVNAVAILGVSLIAARRSFQAPR
jgi:hypothetical protein